MRAAGTWILLRGLGREARHWGRFLERMRAVLPEAELRPVDLPGCGGRNQMQAPSRVPELLAAVRAEAFGGGGPPPRPVHLCGISLGAMVACEWMRCHPDEVERAVLFNASAADRSPPWKRLRPAGAIRLVRASLAPDLRARERHIYQATSTRPAREDEVSAEWVEIARSRPVSAADVGRLLLAASRFRLGILRRLPPVLLLVGARDRLVDPSCSAALAGPLGAELRSNPTAGHDLPLDAPDWAVEQIAAWIDRTAKPRSAPRLAQAR